MKKLKATSLALLLSFQPMSTYATSISDFFKGFTKPSTTKEQVTSQELSKEPHEQVWSYYIETGRTTTKAQQCILNKETGVDYREEAYNAMKSFVLALGNGDFPDRLAYAFTPENEDKIREAQNQYLLAGFMAVANAVDFSNIRNKKDFIAFSKQAGQGAKKYDDLGRAGVYIAHLSAHFEPMLVDIDQGNCEDVKKALKDMSDSYIERTGKKKPEMKINGMRFPKVGFPVKESKNFYIHESPVLKDAYSICPKSMTYEEFDQEIVGINRSVGDHIEFLINKYKLPQNEVPQTKEALRKVTGNDKANFGDFLFRSQMSEVCVVTESSTCRQEVSEYTDNQEIIKGICTNVLPRAVDNFLGSLQMCDGNKFDWSSANSAWESSRKCAIELLRNF